MKNRDWNKVIEYLIDLDNQESIIPSELSKKINVDEKNIENVFKQLHEIGKVIKLKSKTDREFIVARLNDVDYSELLKKRNFFNSLWAWLGYIVLLLSLLEYIFGVADRIKSGQQIKESKEESVPTYKNDENYNYEDSITE